MFAHWRLELQLRVVGLIQCECIYRVEAYYLLSNMTTASIYTKYANALPPYIVQCKLSYSHVLLFPSCS